MKATGGYALLEMLMCGVVFAVILNVSISLFVSTTRLSRAGIWAVDCIDGVEEIRRAFADAVHGAQGVSPGMARYATGADQLVLALPAKEDGGARYLVLGQLGGEEGRLSKLIVVEQDGEFKAEYMYTFRQELRSLHFVYDAERPEDVRLVRLEIEVDNGGAKNTIPGNNTFAAALRCRES